MAPEAEQPDTWEMTEAYRAFFVSMARFKELRRLALIKRDEMNTAFSNRKTLMEKHIRELEIAEGGLLSLYNEFTELYDSMKVIEKEIDSYQMSS